MRYTRSIVTRSHAITAGDIDQFDLPVNPLSHLELHIDFANDTADTRATLAQLLASIDRLEVLYKGSAILSLSGLDLFAWSLLQTGRTILQENHINLIAAVRTLCLTVPFGRGLYNPVECFPATKRGNLTVNIDWAAAFTGFETVTLTIEAVELPGATPAQMTRVTTLSGTPAAAGPFDVALPIGNPIVQLLLWGTTIPTAAVATTTIDLARLLLDNDTQYITETTWEALHKVLADRIAHLIPAEQHFHDFEDTAGALPHVDTEAAEQDDSIVSNHGLIDFDPLRNNEYLLETAAHAAVTLRITAGDDQPLRVLPIELIAVPTG